MIFRAFVITDTVKGKRVLYA